MDKRLILFFVCAAGIFFGWAKFMEWKYPLDKRAKAKLAAKNAELAKQQAKPANKDGKPQLVDPNEKKDQKEKEKLAKEDKKPVGPPKPQLPLVANIPLGENDPKPDSEYTMFANLTNQGAMLSDLQLNRFKSEDKKTPLMLLREETPGVLNYAMSIPDDKTDAGLQNKNWEVVERSAEKVVFRSQAMDDSLQIEKRYYLDKNSYSIRLEIAIKNVSKAPVKNLTYELTGGQGLPIEGKWYTRYFRQMATMMLPRNGSPDLKELLSNDITKRGDKQAKYEASPVQFTGIEAQYFASMVIQKPDANQDRIIGSVSSMLIQPDKNRIELSNIGVKLTSVAMTIEPGKEVVHEYLLFNGPKSESVLNNYSEYHLPALIVYHNFLFIPIGFVAKLMVATLNFLHSFVHDYGLSIIILTILVRGAMFPLTIRQTKSALKMQQLAPKMQEIKEKYAGDKERQSRETMELYRREKVNPLGGCLIMFIQLPIFVGLYQALAQSFSLRHSSFLWDLTWIKDLAAPDQLAPFGFNMIGLGPYFNFLPILSVVLQIIQMKFMSPPSANATPEQEMQRKMMMWMMVFVAYMFYTVPAGLCVYFITSGLWSIMERKLLPKPQAPVVAQTSATTASSTSPNVNPAPSNGTTWKTPVDTKKKSKYRR